MEGWLTCLYAKKNPLFWFLNTFSPSSQTYYGIKHFDNNKFHLKTGIYDKKWNLVSTNQYAIPKSGDYISVTRDYDYTNIDGVKYGCRTYIDIHQSEESKPNAILIKATCCDDANKDIYYYSSANKNLKFKTKNKY